MAESCPKILIAMVILLGCSTVARSNLKKVRSSAQEVMGGSGGSFFPDKSPAAQINIYSAYHMKKIGRCVFKKLLKRKLRLNFKKNSKGKIKNYSQKLKPAKKFFVKSRKRIGITETIARITDETFRRAAVFSAQLLEELPELTVTCVESYGKNRSDKNSLPFYLAGNTIHSRLELFLC